MFNNGCWCAEQAFQAVLPTVDESDFKEWFN
jgi:hypothetical protein